MHRQIGAAESASIVSLPARSSMSTLNARLDPAFLEQQRNLLTALRRQLLAVRQGSVDEQAQADSAEAGQAREQEDDAQKLTRLELQSSLAAAGDDRLSNIERALQKIADGSYGLSERSGAPIPLERLKASPEALYTLDEQRLRDAAP
jgi:DnaK suppressor protein